LLNITILKITFRPKTGHFIHHIGPGG